MVPDDVIIIRRCCHVHLVVGNWLWALHRHECSGERERDMQLCATLLVYVSCSTAVGGILLFKTKMGQKKVSVVATMILHSFPVVDYCEMIAVHNAITFNITVRVGVFISGVPLVCMCKES